MKKIIFPLSFFLISLTACAQPTHLDRFYRKFNLAGNDNDGGFGGSINPSFLLNISGSFKSGIAGSGKNVTADSVKNDWFHKITMLRCLTIDATNTPSADREWDELAQSLRDDHFEEWFSIRKGKGHIRLLSKDGKDGQQDVVCVVVGDKGDGLFFHLRGNFSAADKARMESAF